MTNIKFHIIAMSVIIGVTVLIFLLMGRLSGSDNNVQQPDIVTSDRVIFISKASWGLNCNKTYDLRLKQLRRLKQPMPEGFERVQPNNVLLAVSKYCNGKKTCTFQPSDEAFGIKKPSSCRKALDVEYRCFSYDRIWKKSAPARTDITIDCNDK